jgi:hypothetical protein
MPNTHPARALAVTAAAVLSTLLPGTAATAATADTTPPSAPLIGYAEGFYCLTLIVGANRSTDNVTPPSQLRYEVYADGALVGALTDQGQPSGPWGVLRLPKAGPNTVTVRAVDAAGNRSRPGNADVVTGYFTPGCTPYHF